MPDIDAIKEAVQRYLQAVSAADIDGIAALYHEDATVEDPVGTPALHGIAAIRSFYARVLTAPTPHELVVLKAAANTAIFVFRVSAEIDGVRCGMDIADIMTFDDDAAIISMRAVWRPEDLRPI